MATKILAGEIIIVIQNNPKLINVICGNFKILLKKKKKVCIKREKHRISEKNENMPISHFAHALYCKHKLNHFYTFTSNLNLTFAVCFPSSFFFLSFGTRNNSNNLFHLSSSNQQTIRFSIFLQSSVRD